ncbi:MAG: endospore germination permease [Dehalobacterium sp.]
MLEPGKITSGQAGFLMILTVLSTTNLTMPAITAKYAGMDAWLTTILATFPHIALVLVINQISKTFPQESFVSYINKITGKYLGIFLVLGYLWYQIFTSAMITRTVTEFLLTSFMPDTPMEVFIAVMILLTALVVRAGLEVLARTATFIVPIFLFSLVSIFLLTIYEIDLTQLTPILEHGFKPVIHGTIFPALWRGEFILMLFIWQYMNKPNQGLRSMLQAAIIILLIMLPLTVASVTIFGPLTARMHFPTFSLVEYISLGGFLTRLDAIFMAVWFAGVFVKIGVFYYVICLVLSEVLGLKEYKSLVFPIGIILGVLVTTVAPNIAIYAHLFPSVVVPLNFFFEYLIPFGLLSLIYLRGLHRKKNNTKNFR